MLVNVTDHQDEWLRAEARRLGIPITEVLRRVLDARAPNWTGVERTETQLVGYLFTTTIHGKHLYDGCRSIIDMIDRLKAAEEVLMDLIGNGVALHGTCEDDQAIVLCDDAAVARKLGMVRAAEA